jgi:hypothetical protein
MEAQPLRQELSLWKASMLRRSFPARAPLTIWQR